MPLNLFILVFLNLFLLTASFAGPQTKPPGQPNQPTLATIQTNEATFTNVPSWLKRSRAQRIIDRTQSRLEWTIRKINVRFFSNLEDYSKAHPLGPHAVAVTINRRSGSEVILGPKVTSEHFDSTFAHELVHVIIFQKYGPAIPKWLEEGLANHIARAGKVDYRWLAEQPKLTTLSELSHPMAQDGEGTRALDAKSIRYRYVASQAFAELLNRKCSLENLVRLSVGRSVENYLATLCEVKDPVSELNRWISSKGKQAAR